MTNANCLTDLPLIFFFLKLTLFGAFLRGISMKLVKNHFFVRFSFLFQLDLVHKIMMNNGKVERSETMIADAIGAVVAVARLYQSTMKIKSHIFATTKSKVIT